MDHKKILCRWGLNSASWLTSKITIGLVYDFPVRSSQILTKPRIRQCIWFRLYRKHLTPLAFFGEKYVNTLLYSVRMPYAKKTIIHRCLTQHAMKPGLAGSKLPWRRSGSLWYQKDCGIAQLVLLGAVRSHVPAQQAAKQSFSYKFKGLVAWCHSFLLY